MKPDTSLTERVIQCGFEVSNTLGVGFLESVYENALCIELLNQGIEFEQQKPVKVFYKNQLVGNYTADLVIEKKLLVELKVASDIAINHRAQVMNYLKATKLCVALILNFGTSKLGVQRIVSQYIEAENI